MVCLTCCVKVEGFKVSHPPQLAILLGQQIINILFGGQTTNYGDRVIGVASGSIMSCMGGLFIIGRD